MAMRGGLLVIKGNAGHLVGASEPGERLGMRNGIILIHGSIGDDAGLAMRRGFIAVLGNVGVGFGRGMIAGSAFTFGSADYAAGAGMKRGTIALFGAEFPKIWPTFAPSGIDRPVFLTIYLRTLRELGFPVPEDAFTCSFARYNGDLNERGQGEILVRR